MDAGVSGSPRFGLTVPVDCAVWAQSRLVEVEDALDRWVTADAPPGLGHGAPAQLVQAMRYAVLDGGKRLRPLLVLAACEAVDGNRAAALRGACAVELIHAYSLVHDDLPCMDNDVLRRGKPTVHVQFGEATALLAGDALQALAFELLTLDDRAVAGETQAALCRLLARAAGSAGMAGGQAIDLASVGCRLSEQQLRAMHELKTGALLQGRVLSAVYRVTPPAASRPQGLALRLMVDPRRATVATRRPQHILGAIQQCLNIVIDGPVQFGNPYVRQSLLNLLLCAEMVPCKSHR